MAALSVVHRRLKECGLEQFCLQVHSNKSNKREVISDLGRSLEVVTGKSHAEWEEHSKRLHTLRGDLNEYVDALHSCHPTGESVYTGLSKLIGLRPTNSVDLSSAFDMEIRWERLIALEDYVKNLQTCAQAGGHPSQNPWNGTDVEEWSYRLQEDVPKVIKDLGDTLGKMEEAARTLAPMLGFPSKDWSRKGYELISGLSDHLAVADSPPSALISSQNWGEARGCVMKWIKHGRKIDEVWGMLGDRYKKDVTALDIEDLIQRTIRANLSWLPFSLLKRLPVRRAIKPFAGGNRSPSWSVITDDLFQIQVLQKEEALFSAEKESADDLIGNVSGGSSVNWDQLAKKVEWCERLRDFARDVSAGHSEREIEIVGNWASTLSQAEESPERREALKSRISDYIRCYEHYGKAKEEVEKLLGLDPLITWGSETAEGALGIVRARAETWMNHISMLRDWCNWCRARDECCGQRLGNLVKAHEEENIDSGELLDVFWNSFYIWWTPRVIDSDPVLRRFYSPTHEAKLKEFRAVDDKYNQLTKEVVKARLASRVPESADRVSSSSEIGILKREVQKKRSHMPVRKLFGRIPNLLPRIKPCLLMSPLSVAQYLDPEHPPFDLVVFDEASQIPVWDAVGAIARGKETVIVGDPKQLPPTSFFTRSEDEEEFQGDDVVEDLESILDDCMAAQLPWLQLRWHYRSRHESLIAFSNYHYYDNRLLTFPSPHLTNLGVSMEFMEDGIYDKGKSRTNQAEAKTIVNEIVRRLTDPANSEFTIGVVTFSTSQQTLIEDLLEKARQDHPQIERFFSDDAYEPVFVKNLENVQGDERDVILFSICYGPDLSGRVSMNFGPLNRDGGERRLNVAITRSRREIVVFTSIRGENIDLSRTRARGVSDLKNFLDYAERGNRAIAEAFTVDPREDFESPFEKAVHDELENRGYDVHPQIGCSGYRIDLAVVDSETPGRYLLGIECDGANYHSAKTARDRDKLRESVLVGLGWKIHRIWSTDWWNNAPETLGRIVDAIEEAKRVKEVSHNHPPENNNAKGSVSLQAATLEPSSRVEEESDESQSFESESPNAGQSATLVYEPYDSINDHGDLDDFYSPLFTQDIKRVLEEVVDHEGPIVSTLAAKRVASCWDISRLGNRVLERVMRIAEISRIGKKHHGDKIYFWPDGIDPLEYHMYRVNGSDPESRRDASDFPPEEVANAAFAVIESQVSLPVDDLLQETSRLLGFKRTGPDVDRAMRAGVKVLLERGSAKEQDGSIVHLL